MSCAVAAFVVFVAGYAFAVLTLAALWRLGRAA